MTAAIWVIDGPPGCGKTSELTRQCQRAVEAHGPGAVAIASLTRTAATEIASRVQVPDELVGTLHAHAYRGLDTPKLAETPEGLRAWNDEHPLERLTGAARLDDAPTDSDGGQEPGDHLHASVMNHRARLTPREQWTAQELDYDQRWTTFKTEHDLLDFTDLIETAVRELPTHPALPTVLLLDEAQDFSALELTLAIQWAQHTSTTVICADTRQALYGWRGADPDRLDAMPATGRRTLSQSYRVPRAVHAMAQAWAGNLTQGPADYQPTDEPGDLAVIDATINQPDQLLDSIRQDLADGHDAMVLTTCGYMLTPTIRALRAAGLPFHNPHRATQGAWNPMRSAHRLASFLRYDDRVWGDRARTWTWADLWDWIEPLKAQGILPRGTKALIEEKMRADRFGETNAARQDVPVDTLMELLGDPGDMTHPAFRGDIRWWRDSLLASKAKSLDYPITVYEQTGPAALVDEPRITVGTIHSVKGAEADHVYIAPDLSRVGYWEGWQPDGPGRQAIIRMGYVAITRAKHKVTLLDPAGPECIHHELYQAHKAAMVTA